MAFSPLIETAIEVATQWHDGTYRKVRWRTPAFPVPNDGDLQVPVAAHFSAVAMSVARSGWDEITIAAAFLHDVVEDRNRWKQNMTPGELSALVGADVTSVVLEVTEQKLGPDGTPQRWKARKVGYIEVLRTASDRAVAVSLADKQHNLWSINRALEQGIDVFGADTGWPVLSSGPAEQRWFYSTVLSVTASRTDPRFDLARSELQHEIDSFERLTG